MVTAGWPLYFFVLNHASMSGPPLCYCAG